MAYRLLPLINCIVSLFAVSFLVLQNELLSEDLQERHEGRRSYHEGMQ